MSLLTLLETNLEAARVEKESEAVAEKEKAQQKAAIAQELKDRAESTAKALPTIANTDSNAQLSLFSS